MNKALHQPFAILDNSPIGHFVVDQALTVRFWNRCLEEWSGLLRSRIVGKPLAEHFPHLVGAKYRNRIESILRGDPPTTFSSQLHKHLLPLPLPGGRNRIQHTVVSPLAGGGAGIYQALFSIQDVTSLTDSIDQHSAALARLTAEVARRKQAEESLREADRLKNIFIASAAHELNSPLSAIQGYAELLRDMSDRFDEARKVEYANEIFESAQGLSKIINDLLDIARFEEGHGILLEKIPTDPNDLIRRCVRGFETRRASRHVFHLDLATEASRDVSIDPARISQVLENIFSNAIKYSPAGTTITIRSVWDDAGFLATITDQGIGMTGAQVARVFDKFYRADISDKAARGLGLGMSIVKQIIDQHGGTIKIDSTPGQGTTVTLHLT